MSHCIECGKIMCDAEAKFNLVCSSCIGSVSYETGVKIKGESIRTQFRKGSEEIGRKQAISPKTLAGLAEGSSIFDDARE